jgi:hypothetical protein
MLQKQPPVYRIAPPRSSEKREQGRRIRDGAKDPALHLDHFDRVLMVRPVGRAAAVFEQQTFEPAIIRLAHRGVNAHIGSDAGQNMALSIC